MITLIKATPEKLAKELIAQVKKHESESIIILTIRPHKTIQAELAKAKVNPLEQYYLNTTSASEPGTNAIPLRVEDLTGISIAIHEAAQNLKHPLVIFDNFSLLGIRVPEDQFARFTKFIIGKLRTNQIDCIVLLDKRAQQSPAHNFLSQLAHQVIEK